MAIFGRKKSSPAPAPPPAPPISSSPPAAARSSEPAPLHWADIESIRAEWPRRSLDAQADLASWREGVRLYENDDHRSMMRCAQLLAPALAHSLYGEDVLRGADLPETIHKALFSALFPPPDGHTFEPSTQKVCRLALTVIRENGWQPATMGGSGLFDSFIDGSRILLGIALARDEISTGGNIKEFFAVAPTPSVSAPAVADGTHGSDVVDRIYNAMVEGQGGDEMNAAYFDGLARLMAEDQEGALESFVRAARLGSADAMVEAGKLAFAMGRTADARFWMRAAADAGQAEGMFTLGVLSAQDGDLAEAATWYQRAAESGYNSGYAALTQIADDAGDGAAERSWARLGAEAGHPFCMRSHGLHLVMDNPGDAPVARRAIVYIEAAAESGDIDAMVLAVTVNHQLGHASAGHAWAARARATGSPTAAALLDKYGY